MSSPTERYNLIMVEDTGVSMGIPLAFRGKLFVDTKEPRRSFVIQAEDSRAIVTEMFNG